jgi:hypothetical protein
VKIKEHLRLQEKGESPIRPWQKWGPYVSERSWGTVREDYSWNGDAWNFFPFEDAHQRVFRWGEDGIAGWCDRYQTLVFAPAFWNGKDPIVKERLFGLSSTQGNHGEDVKECYYHLDATPTHSYMKYLYKYPHKEFPYDLLKKKNAERSTLESEYELIDTGIFAQNAYFDIFIEYAKISPEDLYIKIEAFNRADQNAPLHLLPQLWFRNQWSWGDVPLPEPKISNISKMQNCLCLFADDSNLLSPANIPFEYRIGPRYLYGSAGGKPLFTNNENTNANKSYFKDGIHRALIHQANTINPNEVGTKAAIHYVFESVPPKESVKIYLRLSDHLCANPLDACEQIIAQRKQEADAFYATIHPAHASEEIRTLQRQAFAGLLWTKQFYFFDVNQWLKGDNTLFQPPASRVNIRNTHWRHLNSMRILSMPDKWEYCWFAAWDLAFHCLTWGLIDIEFAKEQLWLLLFDQFQHPNGAIPAYEWEFSDLNPPVQAWAAYQLFCMQKEKSGVEDRAFLKKCFFKLIMNFAYWVNQVDSQGCNVFEGGFLGLDNITLIDRSQENPSGTVLKQSDGTGWMALFSLNLMRIALELAKEDPTYEGMATKFFQHFVYIAFAIHKRDEKNYELWCPEDGFFYDVLLYPDGNFSKFRVRSLVGLIPHFAVDILSTDELEQFPTFKRDFFWFLKNRKVLTEECTLPVMKDNQKYYVLSLLNEARLKSVLRYIWDPKEFHSPFGIRSLSKYHEKFPFFYKENHIGYEPGESTQKMKGGNSNWRGPIWMPMNYLILVSLKKYATVFEGYLKIKGENEKTVDLKEMIETLSRNLISLFTRDSSQKRPFLGTSFPFHEDPYFKDLFLFYEYFHAETGQGLGASHQTGWSALVANIIDEYQK